MQIKCIIIEDEPIAIKRLKKFIDQIKYLDLCQTFYNAVESISWLKQNQVDLIFLDIQMDKMTGIQFLNSVDNIPQIIITTAYDQYAVKSYEFDITDYLLKPFSFERFVKAVEKAHKKHSEINSEGHIFIKTESRIEKMKFDDILFIEGMNEYLRIHMLSKKVMTLMNFQTILKSLPSKNFMRVHRSYIVNLDRIECVERNRIKIENENIPISETYRESFKQKIRMK